MRRAAKVDGNQTSIVEALRAAGATVCHLHTVGRGVPDLLVGYQGENYLLEVKDSRQPASKQKLTTDERIWHEEWEGQVDVVTDEVDALTVIGAIAGVKVWE